ncbi:MAG TPA: hypothetical protein VFX59_18110 [Polyangiales bacterium]|nr:hypothetical protein [Polyangiales bacterium]
MLAGNVLAIPALALPGRIERGLPTGVQLYADLWREDLCLTAGAVLKRAGFSAA